MFASLRLDAKPTRLPSLTPISLFTGLLLLTWTAVPPSAAGQVEFTKADASSVLTGVQFSSSSIADVNGDGNKDLLITGQDANFNETATLYFGDGQGGFTEADASSVLTGGQGGSSSIADVNGDGNKDLLITGPDANLNEPETATLYFGDGQGGFTEADASSVLTGVGNGSSSIADVNGDGNKDLLITGFGFGEAYGDPTATLYFGDGQGGFTEADASSVLTGVDISSSSIADVNGDGNKDLLITGQDANFNQTATLYFGDGQGGFTEADASSVLTGVQVGSSSIADVNGDGNKDLLITGVDANDNQTATLYFGDGQGGFTEADASSVLTGVQVGSSSIADVNGDGNKDLLITGQDANDNQTATLYFGDGQGGFTEADASSVLTGVQFSSSSIADVNGDGNKDLLITGQDANGNQTATLYLNGEGAGSDRLAVTNTRPESSAPSTQVRIRGSGFSDTASENTVLFDSTTTAQVDSASSTVLYARVPEGLPAGPVSVQVESGGETAVSGQRFTVLSPERGGGPIDRIGSGDTQIPGLKRAAADWADYDGDGDLDLAITGEDADGNPVTRLYKNGPDDPFVNDQFVALGAGFSGLTNGAVAWGDYNNDGRPDLAVGGTDGSSPSTLVYRNDGGGTFTEITGPDSTGLATGDLAWGDLDGDGDLDLVASGIDEVRQTGQPKTIIYENKGDADDDGEVEFDALETGLTGLSFSSVDLEDINGDGNLDLVISGSADGAGAVDPSLETIVYENQGAGNLDFQSLGLGLDAVQLGSAEWGDYNQDGRLDLLLTGQDGSNSPQTLIYENQGDTDGDGSPNFQSLGAGLTSVESGRGTWGDYDGDGDLDVVLSGRTGDGGLTTEIYQNDGAGAFSLAQSGLNGTEGSVTWADYDQDGDLDILSLGRDASGSPSAVLYDNGLPTPPQRPTAELRQVENEEDFPGDDSVAVGVLWSYPNELNTESYNIYRDTKPIPTGEGPSGLELSGTESTNRLELYLDPESSPGQTYYYRITAVDQNGRESSFSDQVRFFWYPRVVSTEAERTFGRGQDPSDYRLIALPGRSPDPEAAPRTLPRVLPDEASWRAFWDDGSAPQDYIEYDESSTFYMRPGRGFWALSTKTWTSSGLNWKTVDLRGDSMAVVDLHAGWNIVSNPTGKDISWNEVLETNDLEPNGLFSFNGTYSEEDVMASAQSGEAYYFLNDTGLEELLLPYPGAPGQSPEKSVKKSQDGGPRPALVLQARMDSMTSEAEVQFGETAEEGYGDGDVVAPTSRFSALGLRLENPSADPGPRRGYLSTERRPQVGSGQTFDLALWARGKGPVEMEARRIQSLSGREVSLIVPAQERSYDLREDGSFAVETGQDTTRMRLVVGSSSYVEEQRGEVVPEELTLEAYPNPARQQATLRYGLPEERPVRIAVYDVLGRQVAQVTDGQRRPAGRHRAEIDADRLPSGMYFIRMKAGGETKTRKLTVVK